MAIMDFWYSVYDSVVVPIATVNLSFFLWNLGLHLFSITLCVWSLSTFVVIIVVDLSNDTVRRLTNRAILRLTMWKSVHWTSWFQLLDTKRNMKWHFHTILYISPFFSDALTFFSDPLFFLNWQLNYTRQH